MLRFLFKGPSRGRKGYDMATTRIWAVKSRPDHVLDYATNPGKTANPAWSKGEYQTMRDVMDYAMNDYKTEHQYYVTALNCHADCAREQMRLTKQQFQKTEGILAFHGYQSFAEGEVDADTAHKIGVELAKELWPEYQIIVATHLNTHCFHNHFVLNSVSFLHGGKFNACRASYAKMRANSDRLCKERGLSVITEHKAYYPKHYAEWDAQEKGQPTWRSTIREDVDKAVMASMSFQAFLRSLKDMGYEIKTGVKHMTARPPGKERFVRLRSLGESYTEEAIRERILKQRAPTCPPRAEPPKILRVKVYGDFRFSKITWKGLHALYFFYLRKLRAAQRQPQGIASYLLREDLRHLDALDVQSRFLFKHGIDTAEQLADYRYAVDGQLKELYTERRALNNEQRRADVPQMRRAEIRARITALSEQAKPLRRDLRLCDAILERSLILKEKAEQIKQMEQEEKSYVPTRRSGRADRQYGD